MILYKRNIFILALCQALMMSSNTLLITSAALVGYGLSSAKSLATLPLGLQFFATMLSTPTASLLMRHIGRQYGFMLGALLGACGATLATLAILEHHFWLFCIGTTLIGSFNGFAIFYRFAAVDAAPEDYKSRAISYVMAGGVIAAFVGPNLARWTQHFLSTKAFAGGYACLIGFYLASILLLYFLHIPKPSLEERTNSGRPMAHIVQQPLFIVALIGGMFGYGIMSLVMTATPLAMQAHPHPFSDTAFVIQWHVLAMFAPSFFTGQLIQRYGVLNIMLFGCLCMASCVGINLLGESLWHFWGALVALGLGWNFLFIGATTLLTETYRPQEKAKVQALNDFLVFSTVTIASLSSGALQYHLGWRAVNMGVIPAILLICIAIACLKHQQKPA